MSGKINLLSSKKWIPWAIVILLVGGTAILHFYLTTQTMINKSVWWNNLVVQTVVPSGELLQYSVIESIRQFSGSEIETAVFWRAAGMSVLGLLIVLILAPWMFVKGYLSMERSGNPDKLIPLWYAGAAVIVVAISSHAYLMGNSLIQHQGNQTMIEASRSTDELRSVMMDLAFDASERMILPSAEEDGEDSVIRLESLPSYREWDQFEILITEQLGDSVLTLTGTLRDENMAQASVSRPITMRITPQNDELFDYVNSSEM